MLRFTRIAVLDNEVQAQILGDVLNDKGIPHVIRSYHDSALNGIYQIQKGWGCVEAPASHKEQILAIIESISVEVHELDAEEDPSS